MQHRSVCTRCGKSVAVSRSGHLRQHQGRTCKRGYKERMRGEKAPRCIDCFRDRQQPLFQE